LKVWAMLTNWELRLGLVPHEGGSGFARLRR
jgi:hypothetical protein